jgi:hypothetical protein
VPPPPDPPVTVAVPVVLDPGVNTPPPLTTVVVWLITVVHVPFTHVMVFSMLSPKVAVPVPTLIDLVDEPESVVSLTLQSA